MHCEDIGPGNHLVTMNNLAGRPILSKPHSDLPRKSKVCQPPGFFCSCPEFNNPTFIPIRAANLITQHRYLKSLICQPATNPPNNILHSSHWSKTPNYLDKMHGEKPINIVLIHVHSSTFYPALRSVNGLDSSQDCAWGIRDGSGDKL